MTDIARTDVIPACAAPGCQREARAAGYCPKHYQQVRRHSRLTPEREYEARGQLCKGHGCAKAQIAKGLCFRHYQQVRRWGRLTPERERTYGRTGCRVPGCAASHASRGYCRRHYVSEYYLGQARQREVSEERAESRAQAGGSVLAAEP